MSLAAAMLLGSSAFAIDNIKVDGDAKVFYTTSDKSIKGGTKNKWQAASDTSGLVYYQPDMFNKDASAADAALRLSISADLTENISAGATYYAVSTLGLENNLVSNTWSNAHGVSPASGAAFAQDLGGLAVDDEGWLGEAWIAGTLGHTTVKAGRMALDTPLLFSETWGMTQNTFEGAVIINQDIPDTTVVAGWVGKSNGAADDEALINLNDLGAAAAGYVAQGGKFSTYAKDGAYAVGAINNSWEPLTVQGWYYDLQSHATAYWLQADLNMEGILAGAQYAGVDLTSYTPDYYHSSKTNGYAVMLGYDWTDVGTFKAAYSSMDDDGVASLANTATGGQSKFYTELWWAFMAAIPGNDTIALSAEATVGPDIGLFFGWYNVDVSPKVVTPVAGSLDTVNEYVGTVSKTFGPFDTSLALIYDDYEYNNVTDYGSLEDEMLLQVYLTYNF